MNPSVFVLVSGGIDSVFLILKLLNDGYNVSAGYCEIQNNTIKTRSELRALSLISEQIKRLFPNTFTYHGTIVSADNKSTYRSGISYRQVPYLIQALILSPIADYRALAYVSGDSSIKNLDKIKAAYNGFKGIHYGFFPKLIFPLKNTTKAQILEYMEKYYSNILDHCVFCEYPDKDNLRACGDCTPCTRMMSIASEIKQSNAQFNDQLSTN